MDIQALFKEAMKRDIPQLLPRGSRVLNLGAGNQVIPGAIAIDFPEWDAEREPIHFADSSFDSVIAYHFLEHFSGKHAIRIIREVERVLAPGGTFDICVPYYNSSMAAQDLDHKSFWNEGTFANLFGSPYYDKNREVPWQLEVHFQVVIGIVERNMCMLAQLKKEG